ncbi:MAG: hypothetical protein AAFX99_23920, partial [Myxococcota bacterium]
RTAAAEAVIRQGLTPDPTRPIWLVPLDAEQLAEATRIVALVEARAPDHDNRDLMRVTLRRPPGGHLTRVEPVFNLTHTRDADERLEARQGTVVVASSWSGTRCLGLLALDFSGEPLELTADWPELDRLKIQVTNWQEVGQREGLGQHRVLFRHPLNAITVSTADLPPATFDVGQRGEPPRWRVSFEERRAAGPQITTLMKDAAPPVVHAQRKGRPGHLGWMVDTVRDISWVGPTKIQILEHTVFEALDTFKLGREALLGPQEAQAPELAAVGGDNSPTNAALDPEATWLIPGEHSEARIWPPQPATPVLDPPGPGEGAWVAMTQLVKPAQDRVPYFYQSWIRPDPNRSFAQVAVTAWDPARVHLGFVAGTREPDGSTGLKGTGMIPRRPGLLSRMVAAFNGGFQTKHGHWGMVVERQVLLPPLGGGATVATTDEGRIVMGTWPDAGKPRRRGMVPPGKPIPKPIVSLRQNLQPLVDGDQLNPTGRVRWGGTAGVGTDGTHTTRTSICLMEGGAMAYFFGHSLSADTIGMAMQQFHCSYGIHLDMNSGHSGFEFYHVRDDQGSDFEARRMVKHMGHMKFPRYIQTDVRDFFYLTLRNTTADQLTERTSIAWHRPWPGQGSPPLLPSALPARLLEGTLPVGDTTLRIVRLPQRAIQGQTERLLTAPDGVPDGTAVRFSVQIPTTPTAHLRLSPWTRWGELQTEPGELGQTIPVLVLAREGAALPEAVDTWPYPEQNALLIGLAQDDVFMVEIPTKTAIAAARDALLGLNTTAIVALPLAQGSSMGLVWTNAHGQHHMEGGQPSIGDDQLTVQLRPAPPTTGRVESLFETATPSEPEPSTSP